MKGSLSLCSVGRMRIAGGDVIVYKRSFINLLSPTFNSPSLERERIATYLIVFSLDNCPKDVNVKSNKIQPKDKPVRKISLGRTL